MCMQGPLQINHVGFRACAGAPSSNAIMGGKTEKKKWRNSREEVKLTLMLDLALQTHRVCVLKPLCLAVRLGPLQSPLRERSHKARSYSMWL